MKPETYPTPATPLPWSTLTCGCHDDWRYIVRAANAFPHLVEILEEIAAGFPSPIYRARDALAIARGEVTS